ncbi:MAG: ribonuclease P protein component [Candidatus Latescibacterota bacterium]|nr:MAG: ribonuclease P protein component [Candidatus Latescibacterota bacterium]
MPRNVLRSPWQFRLVYQDGTKIVCKYAILFYHRTGEPNSGPLFGVVASKRVGNAVSRNRAKRLLREAIRNTEHRFTDRDLWVVLVARGAILEATSGDVARDLENALMGEGLIRGHAPN